MTDATRNDQVADLIARRRKVRGQAGLVRSSSTEPPPLSSVQLSLWTAAALAQSSSEINRPTAYRLSGPLDRDALRTALAGVVARHEALRTVYPLVGEEPIQQVLDPFPVNLEVVDLSHLAPDRREAELGAVIDVARSKTFDVAVEAAFAAVLVVEAPDTHVLVLALSHLAFDGWSESVLAADLVELYRAALEGIDPQLPPLEVSYADYARWQRGGEQVWASDRAYWATALAGLGQAPPLSPTQRPEPGGPNSCAGQLDAATFDAVLECARRERTTPFVVMLTALELLGRELLDSEDFAIVCPVAGRDQVEVHNLVGCFINLMEVRTSLVGAETVGELLGAVRSEIIGGLAHRFTPTRDVLEPWRASRHQLELSRFSFQWRDFPRREPVGPVPIDLDIVPIASSSPRARWSAGPEGDGATIMLEFDPRRVSVAEAEDWIGRFGHFLELACGAPETRLPAPRHVERPPDPCLPLRAETTEPVTAAIERQVMMTPDAVAVTCEAVETTYADLWHRSGVVAGKLIEEGVEPGDPVVVVTEPNAGHVVAMVAVLRAGAVVVPLDAALPHGRRELMITMANARHAVVIDACVGIDAKDVPSIVHLDRSGRTAHAVVEADRIRVSPAEDRAYLMFTSGTTGTPKAVVGTHQALSHFVAWERGRLAVRPNDTVAGVASPSFDVNLREIFLPLTTGACLSIAPPGLRVDQAIEWLGSTGATVVHITPSLAAAWLAADEAAQSGSDIDDRGAPLRWTVFAGEPLHAEVVDQWRDRVAPSTRVMNFYGPTETCMIKACHEVRMPRPGIQPAGTAMPYTQLLVVAVDEDRLCSPGEVGELVIRTAIGTLGYLNGDGDGFVPNPFAPQSGETVYRTGDVAWYEPDWSVTVQGRLDDQVKIDGIRVEPGEAASHLAQHPTVSQCVVLPVASSGGTRLEAFVVPGDRAPEARELRKYLRDRLRAPSIPSAFHVVSRIPLTPNQKTDRRALLVESDERADALSAVAEASASDRTLVDVSQSCGPVEEGTRSDSPSGLRDVVAASWADVLDRASVDNSTDFFAAGGTSLRALRILAQLASQTGAAAPIDLFFDHPTLGEFTRAFVSMLEGAEPAVDGSASPVSEEIEAMPVSAPLSFGQQRLWVAEQMAPGLGQYVVPICRWLHGSLDTDALEQALTELVARHDVLRSRVTAEHGQPQLLIGRPEWVSVEQHDLRPMPVGERDATVERLVADSVATPFDLANDLPVRVRAIRVGAQEWVLVIAMHHIVVDGLSYPVLFDELAAFYRSALTGAPSGLAPLDVQYQDFAAWQRERAAAHGYDRALDHWAGMLAAPPPRGPTGTPEPNGDPEVPVVARRVLPEGFGQELTKVAGDLRVSPYMVMLALVGGVICDEADEDEMATAIVFADRSWPPWERLIGYFINTLPLRIPVPVGASLAEVASTVRRVTLEAYHHGDVPLDLILERLRLDRPTVDRLVNAIDVDLLEAELDTAKLALEGLTSRVYEVENRLLKFDLSISLSTSGEAVSLRVKGRASLYAQADLDRIADRLMQQALRCLEDPSLEIRRRAMARREPPTEPELVPERVKRLAEQRPDRPAIIDGHDRWSTARLAEQADSIAAFLVARGVRPGDRVVLAAGRSSLAIAAMYGIWRAGAAYVPIDPTHPSARTKSIITDSNASLVLTDDRTLETSVPVILLDDAANGSGGSGELPGASPDATAYVIFTSGSTGEPKGVEVPHRAVAAFVMGASEAYGLTADDTVLQFHSLAFDASVEEIHLPLALGASVVLRPDDLLGSARRFIDFVEAQSISVVSLPTAFWHELTYQINVDRLALPACLHTLIIGGEAARTDVVEAWLQLGSDVRLINSYGPTEATVAVAGATLRRADTGGAVAIGRPFGSSVLLVVDAEDSEAQPGEFGELLIGGPQLASGYLGRPASTSERFVTRSDGRRWYRTGDRARRRRDGQFEVVGRLDQQVKIDGHRIEPAEVEHALRSLADVDDVVVIPVTSGGSVALHAFVVGTELEAGSVRAALADQLPAPMVPAQVRILETLPTGVGGKIDRGVLRSMADQTPEDNARGAVAAAGEADGRKTVERMSTIWGELLNVEGVDAASDFFALGGRSLTAVRLAYLVEQEFGVSLAVASVFDTPTVGGLSAVVDASLGIETPADDAGLGPAVVDPAPVFTASPPAEIPPPTPQMPPELIDHEPPDRPGLAERTARDSSPETGQSSRPWLDEPVRLHLDLAPLAPAQQRVWLHQQLRTGTLSYRIPLRFRLRGLLDVEALRSAIDLLVARHEALRTRITVLDGRPFQRITPVSALVPGLLQFVDLVNNDPLERPELADAVIHQWRERRFDLDAEHPFDALLVQFTPSEHHLVLRFHHIAVDAGSMQVALSDLQQLYAAETHQAPAPTEPPLQFADYAVWQRARSAAGVHDDAAAYWRDIIGDSPRAIDLPGRPPDARPSGVPRFHNVDVPESVARALIELAEQSGFSNFQLLVALTAATLHRLTGAERLMLGAPSSERLPGVTDTIVGLLVNTMVVPTNLTDDTTFRDLLVQVRGMVGRSIEHGGIPFDLLIDEVNAPRDPHRLPLISAMCSMHEAGASHGFDLPGVDVETVAGRTGDGAVVADLMVAGVIGPDGQLTLELRHDQSVLEPWVVSEMARSFAQLAAAAVADPDRSIAELPLLDRDEAVWLAHAFNQNHGEFPGDVRVERTVAEVAASQPGAVAVADTSGKLTYGELVERAGRLADRLRTEGIRPGDTVAIGIGRSAALVVAMLAVLEANAVYVPLDQEAPPRRRDQILQLAGAQALITADDGGFEIEQCLEERVVLPEGDAPAYVMFTSGSTGVPKGAVISHRAIQRTVQNIDYAPLAPGDVVAMASNPAFDAVTFEVWGALVNGARLEVFDTDTLGDPADFARQLAARSVTTMFLTTSLVNVVNQAVPNAFATLDTLIVGGEAVDVGTMRDLVRHGPRRLVNGYGPTECTTFSVWHLVEDIDEDRWTVPIGVPTRNTSVHVVDDRGALVPRGIPGELCIAGPGVALGYLGDDELTDERFVELSIDGQRVRTYRTGDVVRRRLDGIIEYLGRRDHQVKLRGFRIELGGIETALLRNPDVGAAAVRVFGEGPHRRLVAYVAPTRGATIDEPSVRSRVADAVPSYMVPSRIVVLDALPLNQSGKVDRLALMEPDPETGSGANAGDELTDLERTVLDAWSLVLDCQTLGPDDDFFDQGGNSLLGVEALAALEGRFGRHFRLSSLFEARTARAFASMVEAEQQPARNEAVVAHFVTLQRGDRDQTPLWLIHPAGGSLVLYEPLARHLPGHRRIVGVEASGLDGDSEPLESVAALADHQVDTILQVQPRGPYRLLGYSIGGIVGLEVARRLRNRGEHVEFLGAIEAGVPSGPTDSPSRLQKYRALLRRRDFAGIGATLLTSLRNRRSELEVRVAAGRGNLDRAHKRVLDSMVHAFHQFAPSELDIAMTLFYGDDSAEASVQRLCERWGELATAGVSVLRVSGSHADDLVLRDPHAEVLAAAVDAALSTCDQA